MNLSGRSKSRRFYKVPASQICVLHDELDMIFKNPSGVGYASARKNNGVKSITQMQEARKTTPHHRLASAPKIAADRLG